MPYHLTIEERPGYLHAKVTGTHSTENLRRFLKEVREACVQRSCFSVLLETNLSGPSLGASSIFSVVSERSADAATLRRIAYVDPGSERSPEQLKFAETVAVNRGVNVRLFRTVAEAERWISDSPAGAGR